MKPWSSSSALTWGLRLLLILIFLLPFVWMLSAALLPPGSALSQSPRFLNREVSLENFSRIWELVPFGDFLLNSLRVAVVAVPLTLLTGSWAGFAISQLPLSSQRRWVLLSLATLMMPGIALWSIRFLIYKTLGIYNTFWVLVVPAWMGTSPFYVLMFYRAFHRIPRETFESARLDGAGVLQIWWRIAFPIVRPTAVGVAILSFVFYWGDFVSPLLYLQSEKNYTVSIALQLLQQMVRSDWPLLMAAAVVSTAVPVILLLSLQPFFAPRKN